jgi:hypothetical protein
MYSPSKKRWSLAYVLSPLCVVGIFSLLAALFFYTNKGAKDAWSDLIANIFLMLAIGSLIIDVSLKMLLPRRIAFIWIVEGIILLIAFIALYLYNRGLIGQ